MQFCKFVERNRMKHITLEVKEDKYKFFLELIKNFDFISVSKNEKQKEILTAVARGMKEAQLASKGKIKTKHAKAFINGL
jgi:hypothetical protein